MVPTCDMGDTITLSVKATHCALDGFVASVVVGSGPDRFGHDAQFTGSLAQGQVAALTVPLRFRDAFGHDNVDITVHSRCSDGRKARGSFRCRAPKRERPLPT